jgi:hypothetical protein
MGTNLGDQAIQSACIANLRARLPDVEIVGIYLSTWRTAGLHGIRTHPLTGLLRDHYSNAVELFGPPPQTRAVPVAAPEPAKARVASAAPEPAKAPRAPVAPGPP